VEKIKSGLKFARLTAGKAFSIKDLPTASPGNPAGAPDMARRGLNGLTGVEQGSEEIATFLCIRPKLRANLCRECGERDTHPGASGAISRLG
jgi:hypothetical protein